MFKILILSFMLVFTTAFADTQTNIDADADHSILTPTTSTLNQGDLTFNSYELFLAGLSYGVTDDFQLTFTTLLPMFEGMPFTGLLTGKYKLMDNGNTSFAVQPGVLFMSSDGDTIGTINATFIFDMMLNQDNVLSVSTNLNVPFANDSYFKGFTATLTGAINSRVSKHIKLVAELTVSGLYYDGKFTINDQAMLFNYGVRFFNSDLAAMLSFIRPITSGDNPFLMGFPYVTFTAKF